MNKLTKYPFAQLYDMASGISSTKEQAGHGDPFISFSTVFNNFFLPDVLPDLMQTTPEEQEIYSVKKGDVFVTRTSETIDELAMSCVADKDYPNATFSGFTKRLRPKAQGVVYHRYLAFYLRNNLFRKTITNNAFMTLRASFNEDIFSFLNLYVPDYSEQVKIGDMLFSMEQKVLTNKRICSELEAMAKTLYDYWFTQFDFPNAEGKPYRTSGGAMEWNEQLKREIPKGWEVKPLSYVISSINTGLNPRDNFKLGNGDIQYITVKNLTTSGTIDFSDCDTVDEEARTVIHNRSDISVGDILFASIAPLGRCYLIQNPPENWDINESVFSVRPDYSKMTSEYLYMYFMGDSFIKGATSSSTGSIFKGIRINTLLDLIAVVPDKKVIDAFSAEIKNLLRLKEQKNVENMQLAKLRNWLLPMLMNGQAVVE